MFFTSLHLEASLSFMIITARVCVCENREQQDKGHHHHHKHHRRVFPSPNLWPFFPSLTSGQKAKARDLESVAASRQFSTRLATWWWIVRAGLGQAGGCASSWKFNPESLIDCGQLYCREICLFLSKNKCFMYIEYYYLKKIQI